MLKREERRIIGYEDYTISNYGEVYKNGKRISTFINGKAGYEVVKLKNQYGRKNKYIHRLVYENFVGPIKFEINHIDQNKLNNKINNLEDIPHRENILDLMAKNKNYKQPNQRDMFPVIQKDSLGEKINEFPNIDFAVEWIIENNLSSTKNKTHIRSCIMKSIKKRRNSAYGFIWEHLC